MYLFFFWGEGGLGRRKHKLTNKNNNNKKPPNLARDIWKSLGDVFFLGDYRLLKKRAGFGVLFWIFNSSHTGILGLGVYCINLQMMLAGKPKGKVKVRCLTIYIGEEIENYSFYFFFKKNK